MRTQALYTASLLLLFISVYAVTLKVIYFISLNQ